MIKKIVIIGSGTFAKYLKNSLNSFNQNIKFYGYLSKEKNKSYFKDEDIPKLKKIKNLYFVNGIGNFSHDWYPKLFKKLLSKKIKFMHLIHKTANVSEKVRLGKGVVITENVLIKSDVKIGNFSLINSNSIISHDTKIGSFCNISLGVKIAGNSAIGTNCLIGMGSIILNNLKIGNNVVIGAGAIVTKNIPKNTKVIGKSLKKRKRV
jgi:sugar O-acyltransferase (sialic acid O-acetyltransferase NeuD family)